jgi:hypothetical protein
MKSNRMKGFVHGLFFVAMLLIGVGTTTAQAKDRHFRPEVSVEFVSYHHHRGHYRHYRHYRPYRPYWGYGPYWRHHRRW